MKLKEPLVSIVIPIFNAERYLDKCIRSILKQTYKNIELILVDDGSKDNSGNICKKYTNLDERVLLIQGENHGVSFSRNVGIENVSGEYIAFIDADDTINEKYIERLLYNIKKTDLSVCGYYEINSQNDIIDSNLNGERVDEVKSSQEFLRDIFTMTYGYQGYIWNKLFKADIIKDNCIRFDTEIYYNEDRLFIFEYLLKCEKIYYSDEPLYYYFINNTGAMAARRNNVFDKKMISELEAFDKMLQLLKNKNSYIADEILVNAMDSTLVLSKLSNEEKLKQYKYKYLVKILKNSNISKRKKLKFIEKSIESKVLLRGGELLSIIVPVYNVEKFLPRCIESIIGQTYGNLEILLIDDGSTDYSGEICDLYQEIDNRIKVYHTANFGVSAARNLGIENIKGRYLAFVDSDDFVIENMYENLINISLKQDVGMVVCNWEKDNLLEKVLEKSDIKYKGKVSSREVKYKIMGEDEIAGGGYPWNRLIDLSKLGSDISAVPKFCEDIAVYEDKIWMIDILNMISDVYFTEFVGYHYYIRGSSLSRRSNVEKGDEIIKSQKYLCDHYQDNNYFNRMIIKQQCNSNIINFLWAMRKGNIQFVEQNWNNYKSLRVNLLLHPKTFLKKIILKMIISNL